MSLGNISKIQWSCLTQEQWESYAVVVIDRPSSKDGGGDEDRSKTPYDPLMGEQRNYTPCGTCGKHNTECPGHFGIIKLPFPIYNKIFTPVVLKVLQCVCIKCARPLILPEHISMYGFSSQTGLTRFKAISTKCKNIKKCPWPDCGEVNVNFSEPNKNKAETGVIYYSVSHDGCTKREEFTAGACFTLLSSISNEHIDFLGFNENLIENPKYRDPGYLLNDEYHHVHQFRPESMIFTVLPVLPPLSRPWVVSDGEDNEKKDDDLTDKYNSILKTIITWNTFNFDGTKNKNNKRLTNSRRSTSKSKADIEKELMEHVWTLIDNKNEKSKLNSGGRAHRSIVDRLTGKDGRVQSNVGGKRCDFSARSVIIGGGIRLKDDELGVPDEIAKTLTKQEFVAPWNIDYIQMLIANKCIVSVSRKGRRERLSCLPDKGITYKARNGDIVERTLQNGDVVFFNRQPTLRIESMMAFKIKIVEGMAFQLGLCWTKSFNADFDGDEMNLHVPQSIEAEIEIMVNSKCSKHIVSAQGNGPVNGIVQDGLVASYILTMTWDDKSVTLVPKDIALNIYKDSEIQLSRVKDLMMRAYEYHPEYITLKNGKYSFNDNIPGCLFLSVIFPPTFCYTRTTNVHDDPKLSAIKIENGVILPNCGPICKKSIGSSNGSIVHELWKIDPEYSLKFLSEIQQLTDRWLPTHGFSMGISDCYANSSDGVAKTLIETRTKVSSIINGSETLEKTEIEINGVLNDAMAVGPILAKGSMEKLNKNALNIMRNSGAKGSVINLAQIVAFVGQQNIRGVRMPMSLSHNSRCLPSFLPGDNSPDARGFVGDNYITGLTPQAAFFHAAAGRDGIISTALKSVTGETPIVIIDNDGLPKRVTIGDWIDNLLYEYNDDIEKYTDRDMELLNIEAKNYNAYIPTTDEHGNVSWGVVKNVTRHDPGKQLFRIKTLGGREVTVTESKALLVWDYKSKTFVKKDTPLVKTGDFVPTTAELPVYKINQENVSNWSFINLPKDDIVRLVKNNILFASDTSIIIYGYSADKINMLLSRLGIFGSKLTYNRVSVEGIWASRLSDILEMKPTVEFVDNGVSQYNNVILDKIISIEKVSIDEYHKIYPKYNRKVYDLTIPSTLNFGLANGLHVVDTADTGYVQKRLARKMEDCKICIDGTVRNANGTVISFLYGGDGMDPKKLVSIKGYDSPFFINPVTVAKRLNSDAVRSGGCNPNKDKIRKLKQTEIDYLVKNISYTKLKTNVVKFANENLKSILRETIKDVEVYECKIADFCLEIKDSYINSKAQYGLMAGLIATSSIGEPTTQMVLNVFHLAGFKGKDASLGVPRFKELINITKTADQRNPGCTIYFKDEEIETNANKIRILEEKNKKKISQKQKDKNNDLIKVYKKESLSVIQNFKKLFEEIAVKDLMKSYDMKYIRNSTNSPSNILKYEKYEEKWWSKLSKKLFENENYDINWVLTIHFDVNKLFNHKIELDEISQSIEEKSKSNISCISSPNNIGSIEIYSCIDKIQEYAKTKIDTDSGYITDENIEYFICRDVLLEFVKDVQVSGIKGISKTYPRENLETKEWVMDTDGVNFLKVLQVPGVDKTRTIVDDMHSINEILGIEAARRFLFLELSRVISFDGTYINPRHLSMLADVMTTSGSLSAASRYGIGRDAGPNAKILFEKPVDNAMKACAFGEIDNMTSLSSSVMYGKIANSGPGMVSIRKEEKQTGSIPNIYNVSQISKRIKQ